MNIEELLYYLKQATSYAESHQTCKRKAVGCAIVGVEQSVTLVVYGHNRSMSGQYCKNIQGNCGCLHAESVALFKAIRTYGMALASCERIYLVCNYSPCTACANLIVHSRLINVVYYLIPTEHDLQAIELMKSAGIMVERLPT